MKKETRIFLVILIAFFLIGLGLQFYIYNQTKELIVENNSLIVGTIIEAHPELETEIIEIMKQENFTENREILEKYGFTNLETLEYLESVKKLEQILLGIYIMFFLALAIILIIYFIIIQRRRKKEIQKIDKYLFSLLQDNINVNLKDFQSGELETLQNDLMKVTSKLKNALDTSTKDRQELSKNLADISHQLKTPLTSLFVINEALQYKDINETQKEEFIKKQEEILTHIETLITSLLKVSQIESGMITLKKETISLTNLLKEVYNQLELIIVSKNIKVTYNIPKNIKITGDAYWLREALSNIVKNACEHVEEKGSVTLTAKETPMFVELVVEDNGCGIKESDLLHIFERFYKSSPNKNSIGIGLNLTKSILDKTNATIRVQSEENKYTKFTIHFYKSVV